MNHLLRPLLFLAPVASILLLTSLGSCNSAETATAKTDTASSAKETSSTDAGFVSMFDGKTLTGWEGDTAYWRVENGEIVGEVTLAKPLKNNTFLIWKGSQPGDFEFKAEFKINPTGNSGVQYRSEELKDIRYALKGYQADIDGANTYTGQNYEERGRGFLAMRGQIASLPLNGKPVITGSLGSSDSLKALIKSDDWNEIHIVVKGNRMKHYINGVLMSDATDDDTANQKFKGLIGLQVHVMPTMKVQYRKLFIKE